MWCAPMGAALAAVADAAAGAAVSRKLRRWSGLRISSVREPGVQRQGAAMPRIGVWCKPGAKNTIRIFAAFCQGCRISDTCSERINNCYNLTRLPNYLKFTLIIEDERSAAVI